MYLHLGQNVVVPSETVIGIFDMDNTTGSHLTRAFLNGAQKSGQIVNISDDLPKSFIVCCQNGNSKVYLSQLSATTLFKRSETSFFD